MPNFGGGEVELSGEGQDVKAGQLEHGGEEGILFEAVAASAPLDELGLEAVQVEPDRAAEQEVEIREAAAG